MASVQRAGSDAGGLAGCAAADERHGHAHMDLRDRFWLFAVLRGAACGGLGDVVATFATAVDARHHARHCTFCSSRCVHAALFDADTRSYVE